MLLIALVLGLGGGLFYYSNRAEYLLGQIAAVAMTPLALHGVWRGGFRKAAMILVLLALGAGFGYLRAGANALLGLAGLGDGGLTTPVAAVFALGIWIIAFMTTKSVRASYIERTRFRRGADRLAGLIVGMTEGGLMVLTLCWLATSLEPFGRTLIDSGDTVKGSPRQKAGQSIVRLSQEARIGVLGDLVRKTNPVEKMPALREMIREANRTGELRMDDLDPETLRKLQDVLKNVPGAGGGTDIGTALQARRPGGAPRGQAARDKSRRGR
ncbi:MAG: hypothetical protein DCC65_08000 [Planctomycetota bacterium]|nr:MAG: hypothetical protein DCC65_08000 [Planctomycetota bacterium]